MPAPLHREVDLQQHHEKLAGPHEALIHGEPHISSTPQYYAEMFGLADAQHPSTGQLKDDIGGVGGSGYPYHTASYAVDPYHEHEQRVQHRIAEQAHHPEVRVTGVQDNLSVKGIPELGHLDETPYEHDHVDFESRFIEQSPIPHHEITHDSHGIQELPK